MKNNKREEIWVGRAIEDLCLQAKEKNLPQPGGSQINIVQKIWEHRNKPIKSIQDFVTLIKKNSGSQNTTISTTHMHVFSGLRASGIIKKTNEGYALNMNHDAKDSDRFAWLGSVLKEFKINSEKDSAYKLGERKLKIFMWVWEHQDNLPVSTRAFSISMKQSAEGKPPATSVTETLKGLIVLGFMKKEKKKYSLIKK